MTLHQNQRYNRDRKYEKLSNDVQDLIRGLSESDEWKRNQMDIIRGDLISLMLTPKQLDKAKSHLNQMQQAAIINIPQVGQRVIEEQRDRMLTLVEKFSSRGNVQKYRTSEGARSNRPRGVKKKSPSVKYAAYEDDELISAGLRAVDAFAPRRKEDDTKQQKKAA